jgi:hypothetical protein
MLEKWPVSSVVPSGLQKYGLGVMVAVNSCMGYLLIKF